MTWRFCNDRLCGLRPVKITSCALLVILSLPSLLTGSADTSTQRVAVLVAAEDRSHNPITDLTAGELSLKVDGVPITAASIRYTGHDATDWMLLVDSSNSMRTESLWAPSIAAAAAQLTSLMGERGDRVAVASSSDQFALLQELTTDQSLLAAAIGKLRPAGATALYDSLLAASDYLLRTSPPDHPKIIWVVTDAGDNSSRSRPDEVAQRLSRSAIPLLLSLPGELQESIRPGELAVGKLAKSSGGTIFHVDSKRTCLELAQKTALFSRKLYRVEFPAPSGNKTHKIELRTSRPGVKLLDPKRSLHATSPS